MSDAALKEKFDGTRNCIAGQWGWHMETRDIHHLLVCARWTGAECGKVLDIEVIKSSFCSACATYFKGPLKLGLQIQCFFQRKFTSRSAKNHNGSAGQMEVWDE
ncbi:hypothetical protein TNIN_283181 [Trichonephila inaurata madagascariensis]|uniref:Uncharacterized protein n=1 Tax=Trichonephila inaurata madagascariensis TaxID=2747483 RepID=A0A8X6JQH9_9ARAC|nr:hypothetical protein TNIN_283181 [Trichonephila inaurata madagascariensis]